jgi:DNA-binding transcriptional MocR family regulator
MAAVMQMKIGDPAAKLVLLALADRADKETGQCWPSLARIAEDTELSVTTVKRRLNKLEERGLIRRDQRDHNSTLYTLAPTEPGVGLTELGGWVSQSHEPTNDNLSKNLNDILINQQFEDWWQHYPKKAGKGQARVAYRAAVKKVTHDELVEAADCFSQQCQYKEKQFIPYASTWLNGERWLDEDETTSAWGDI